MAGNGESERIVNYLNNNIEKIIFNKESLNDLKNIIEAFSTSNKRISSKELKQHVVNYLMSIYNKLLNFLPYYLKFASNQKGDDTFDFITTSNNDIDVAKIKVELSEKDKFLEEIGLILDNICEKIVKNP